MTASPSRFNRQRIHSILSATLLLALCLSTCGGLAFGGQLNRFEFTQPQMGVPFRIVLYAANADQARTAAEAAYARIADLNQILSNYETDSELSLLGYQSGKASWTRVSPDLFRIITRAQALAAETEGAFDLTIGPLAAAWRNARRTHRFPDRNQLERFQRRVGWQHLKLNHSRQQVWLSRAGMRLDPGGIAKGDALDQALIVLRQEGIHHALVAGAGDIAVSAPPPNRSAWRIALVEISPDSEKLYLDLAHQAVATSGDLYQFVEIDGIRYSHIVDPETGLGLTERRLVSVIAPNGITADSLATAFSVLPLNRIPAVWRNYPKTAVRLVRMTDEQPEVRNFGSFPTHRKP